MTFWTKLCYWGKKSKVFVYQPQWKSLALACLAREGRSVPKDWVLAASRAGAGPAAGHATGETLAVPWDRGLGTGVC